ncbi:uncharacterized protein [Anoplolepis gracilipes]|uniref:uncharacterized protein n=1 Tax=Anoplolepis gracilipes TaxID=354296 RepID=UPI003BA3B0D9
MTEVMSRATKNINLREMGIEHLRPKRTITGGLLLEIPGEKNTPKADKLAGQLSKLLEGLGVKIFRPKKMAEIRLSGMDESVDAEAISRAVAEAGGCTADEVQVATPKKSQRGLLTAWCRCPETAAHKAAQLERIAVR